jgi:4-hydroxybutyrate dehydrogenase/sulfolactaldehyde 3-reductase
MAALARSRGIGFVDAPVGRLASHADRGESLFMVGGSEADVARVRPMLEAMGNTIYHCGDVGTGTRTKLVNNYLAVTSCQLNAEALALSQRFGLSLPMTLDVLYGTTAVNGQLKIAWPVKVLKGDIEPGFTIDLAHKDLTLIVEAANTARVPMPLAAAAREAFSTARARGMGGNDFSAMVDNLCDMAGIEKPRLKD